MDEADNNPQDQKPRTSKLAIASVTVGVLCFLILPFAGVQHYPPQTDVFFLNIVGLLGISGLILGVWALVRIKKFRGMLKGRTFAVAGIVLTVLISGFWLLEQTARRRRSIAAYIPASNNLSRLGRAMLIYANDNGQYPEPNQWCDLLLKHGEVGVERFVCPSIVLRWPFKGSGRAFTWPVPKKGRCHFGMNPNCKPNSPPDMVLLFETKEGWNRYGGPEMLTTDNHHGEGCNILFNDAYVVFIRPDDLGNLKWKDDRISNTEQGTPNTEVRKGRTTEKNEK
jgi:hypothetical protein